MDQQLSKGSRELALSKDYGNYEDYSDNDLRRAIKKIRIKYIT
jgi:hypothetical protein